MPSSSVSPPRAFPRRSAARVIFWGIAAAVVLRIFFAAITVQLLAIIGLTLAGGILLLWVCWKMYRQITTGDHHGDVGATQPQADLGFWSAVGLITVADVSMSLDNVLAVAGAAKGNTLVLVIGLAVAIVLMAVASHFIANLLVKYPWITWIGLLIILWVALDMIYDGLARGDLQGVQLRMLGDAVAGHRAPIGAHIAATRRRAAHPILTASCAAT